MNNPKEKLIYIEWEDAVASSAWKDREEVTKWGKEAIATVCDVGWVMEENDKYLVLASRYGPQKEDPIWGNLQKIPKTWIRKRKTIKL